jgi:hypothetical protein
MFQPARYVSLFVALTAVTGFAPASETTLPTRTAVVVDDSPKAALKAYNAAMRTGDVAGMVALQYAKDDDERHVARACAQSDLEVGRLIQTTRQRFGDDAAKAISQAINDEGDADIDAAAQNIDGTHGGVTFVGAAGATPMIRADGGWKVDIAAMLKQYDGTADQLSDQVIRRGSAAKVTTQELIAGHYTTVDAVVTALKARLKDS